ncbi:MAG TPA: protein kinase, partial [Ktedonobacteraceae bacterium]|nr:protein kinase [Ktedonobacteraceae bacterium]
FVTRFQHEAQVIASLRHPNIVQIHDFQISQPPESESPTPYMVMAYIEGKTLADYIARTSARGNIPSPGTLVNLFSSISLAIDYAHQQGMIHRDIKPANILLDKNNTRRNSMGEPILTDFGLAKLMGASAGTLTASSLGTPLYISPEQAQGYAGNERSDLYSLGVILYEMVAGVPPFRGANPAALFAQHINVMPTSPAVFNPNIPPALTMVIMTALSKDPNGRFASASQMTAAAAEALNIPVPEGLSQYANPQDARSMPTYFTSPFPNSGTGAALTPSVATSVSPTLSQPSGTVPAGSSNPGNVTPQLSTSASGQQRTLPDTRSTGGGQVAQANAFAASGLIQRPVTPVTPPMTPSGPPPPPTGRRWKGWYTLVAALVILALLGSGLGAYFVFFHHSSSNVVAAPVPGGEAFFMSSGQLDIGTAQGIGDQLQINLKHVPAPGPGKSYYAWLLGDKQPHVEAQPLEPAPQFKLPLLLGKLNVQNGNASLFYAGTSHNDNLISVASRMLITEEATNGTPLGPAGSSSSWRYYAEIPQTLFGKPQLSALDHIRHLFYKETRVDVLGLPGGLDTWLYRNTEKVMESAIAARDDYHGQATDFGLIHNLFLAILDYLDGSPNVGVDVPAGSSIVADPTASQVALLSVVPAQTNKTNLAHNPPGYLQHVALHLNGVVQAPDATPAMRALATRIIESLNNAKIWLGQVRMDARQLAAMNAAQLDQPATQNLLDDMLTNATYAYIGHLDASTNQVLPGVLQVHYDVAGLATLTLTANLPKKI